MSALQHFALGCCILCALAGILNVFWPDNSYKPVINTVLVLYTLASVAELGRSVDWALVRRQAQSTQLQAQAVPQQSLEEYAAALSLQASADALGELLRKAAIPCTVELEGETCVVRLQDGENRDSAASLLRLNAGGMDWRIETEGEP